MPGPVLDSSIVPIVCANLGGWGNRNVSIELSELLGGIRVLVGNDANVAALGEIWMGTAQGCRSAVMVTLGTGVGGGVIVNGKVIDGAHGAGGEIGHITVNQMCIRDRAFAVGGILVEKYVLPIEHIQHGEPALRLCLVHGG